MLVRTFNAYDYAQKSRTISVYTCMKLKGAKRDVSGLCVTSVDIVIRLEHPLK
jgi:hypothetical protein